jgi:ribosomal-protein-alanine N-acetyltransferase
MAAMSLPAVRLATRGDARVIAELSRDCVEQGLAWSYTESRVLKAILSQTANVAIAGEQDRLLAFGIMDYGDTTAHLVLLAVQPGQRRRGLGRHVLNWLEKSAVTAGIELIRLEVRLDNDQGVAFYQRLGYAATCRVPGYYQGRIDAIRMEKRLGLVPGEGLSKGS